jgi:aspartate kinase
MEKDRIVIKFGGVSLKNSERIKNTANIIQNNLDKTLVVVISAIGESTNELISAGKKAAKGTIGFEAVEKIHREICKALLIDFSKLENLFKQMEKELRGVMRVL